MVALARQRVGLRAEVFEADLSRPLTFLADKTFDLIVCPLVFGYVLDLKPVYREDPEAPRLHLFQSTEMR